MKVYLVVEKESDGHWDIDSIWSNKEQAEKRKTRRDSINSAYSGRMFVEHYELDPPEDSFVLKDEQEAQIRAEHIASGFLTIDDDGSRTLTCYGVNLRVP